MILWFPDRSVLADVLRRGLIPYAGGRVRAARDADGSVRVAPARSVGAAARRRLAARGVRVEPGPPPEELAPYPSWYALLLSAPLSALPLWAAWCLRRAATEFRDVPAPAPVPVRPRLLPGRTGEPPSFWVLAGGADGELADLLRTADEALLGRLDVAVVRCGGQTRTLLRARPGEREPVTLPLEAGGFAALLKLHEILLPAGMRLRPPVRRDLLRKELGREGAITWLAGAPGGGFVIHAARESALRPLSGQVEYTAQAEPRRLKAWEPGAAFEMERFTSPDEAPKRTGPKGRPFPADTAGEGPELAPRGLPFPVVSKSGVRPPEPVAEAGEESPVEAEPEAEAEAVRRRLRELEERFLSLDVPADDPARLALWPEMAEAHLALGNDADGALCWLSALWESSPAPPDWLRRWRRGEAGGDGAPLQRLHDVLTAPRPEVRDLRLAVAWLAESAFGPRPWPELAGAVPQLTRLLDEQEERLPVRAAWLGRLALARLTGGDVLGLTRARDRLLGRLHDFGLNPERDLPSFLRGDRIGPGAPDRLDSARMWELHRRAWQWARQVKVEEIEERRRAIQKQRSENTGLFVDLIFAFGSARLGDADGAHTLLAAAGTPKHILPPPPPRRGRVRHDPFRAPPPPETDTATARNWLWAAFRERAERELAGERGGAAPGAALLRALDQVNPATRTAIDRLRQHSRILEPYERTDPYRFQRDYRGDGTGRQLAELAALTDPAAFRARAGRLFKEYRSARAKFRLLGTAIGRGFRCGEAFAVELLERVGRVQDAMAGEFLDLPELLSWVYILETALALAAHYDRPSFFSPLLGRLDRLLHSVHGERAAWLVGGLSGQCFRSLSRTGLRDEARELCDRMTRLVLNETSLEEKLHQPGLNRGAVYPALLRLSGGWFYFGDEEPARAVLAAVTSDLFDPRHSPALRTELACAYAGALGQAPAEVALPRLEELFDRLSTHSVYTEGTPYHLNELRVVESVVLALAAGEFTVSSGVRRVLDAEEFLIRRRIHRDVRAALSGADLG